VPRLHLVPKHYLDFTAIFTVHQWYDVVVNGLEEFCGVLYDGGLVISIAFYLCFEKVIWVGAPGRRSLGLWATLLAMGDYKAQLKEGRLQSSRV